ncbi:MAG: hypothetical protein ACNA7W_13640 [Pseudomonadales bacterium]
MLTPASRRQILEHMGVDVWRLRVPLGAPAKVAGAPAKATGAPVEALGASNIVGAEVPVAVTPQPDARPQPSRKPQPAVETLSVLLLSLGGCILLIEGSPSRRDQRLATDVLSAACGDWKAKPTTRHFDWPPAGGLLEADADAPLRALEAFVDKDVADHQARLLLCPESVSARLSNRWPGCRRVVIPPLDQLGRDGALKRALWQTMQQLKAEP